MVCQDSAQMGLGVRFLTRVLRLGLTFRLSAGHVGRAEQEKREPLTLSWPRHAELSDYDYLQANCRRHG